MDTKIDFGKFRDFLEKEFLDRLGRNPSYSIRAFARFLDINDSTLSKILNKRLPITKRRFLHLSSKFDTKLEDVQFALSDEQFVEIEPKHLRMLSEWYYPAIMELAKTNNFKSNTTSIAKRLGLNKNQVKICIQDLLDIELLVKDENGNFKCSNNRIWDGDSSEVTKRAHRQLQSQFIQKALDTMYHVSAEKKENASLTVACSPNLMPKIKKRTEAFLIEIDKLIEEESSDLDEVYQLNVLFFPLTKIEEGK